MEDENINNEYCDLLDRELPINHRFFIYDSELKICESYLGLAISEGGNVEKAKDILDIIDTLNEHIYDHGTVLPDNVRKSLRHEKKEWIDIKEKMNSGNKYVAYLVMSASHMRIMLSYLHELKMDTDFASYIDDYVIEFLEKLINKTLNEAMGDVLL